MYVCEYVLITKMNIVNSDKTNEQTIPCSTTWFPWRMCCYVSSESYCTRETH